METIHNTAFGKKSDSHWSELVGAEKTERLAKASLCDLIQFSQMLDDELRKFMLTQRNGIAIDKELFDRMLSVKDKYLRVMQVMREGDEEMERHTLIIFADALQDMMIYMNRTRRH